MSTTFSRRNFLRISAGAAGLSRFGAMNALAQGSSYKALVCVFLYGGNDGHNTIVPKSATEYNAYKAIRGNLGLPDQNTPLLDVSAANGTPYGLNGGLLPVHPLWASKQLAAVANVGMLVQPTTRAQYLAGNVPVPSNLFSHSDQTLQMQSGVPSTGGGTGWAGRVADSIQTLNGAATFPPSVSTSGPVLFCTGNVVQSASLFPGFDLTPAGMSVWPESAATARKQGLQAVLTFDSGLAMVQAANKVRQDAMSLNALLKSAGTTNPVSTPFPGTDIGLQLKQVAQIIALRNQVGMSRQVFFCSLGGFDTHGSQSWQHWFLLRSLADAMSAFYNSTVEMGVAGQVTTFTESEFGRTLQPSGQGSDHGWGNHLFVMGGAVKGGDVYGAFPAPALGGPDDANNRGVLIPTTSLDQYGATLAKWFGLDDAALNTVFPNLANFGVKNIGFMA
ncbi:MAG: DUF1501 domain-containing protein [Acidobacteria bacterium]|nr:DUF1501 domain-containing protein [Acidobacteriota bacterium]